MNCELRKQKYIENVAFEAKQIIGPRPLGGEGRRVRAPSWIR